MSSSNGTSAAAVAAKLRATADEIDPRPAISPFPKSSMSVAEASAALVEEFAEKANITMRDWPTLRNPVEWSIYDGEMFVRSRDLGEAVRAAIAANRARKAPSPDDPTASIEHAVATATGVP